RATRLLAIEKRQHLDAAVAAAHADESGNGWVAPGGVNRRGTKLGRSGHVPAPLEDRVVVDRLEAEAAQLGEAAVEVVAIERAGRRDDGEAVARFQGARLQHHAKRAISAAMARCSSRPRSWRSARPEGGRVA